MIEIKNLTVTYEDGSTGIAAIDITIPTGQCVLCTGKSGCGKSTLLNTINGVTLMDEATTVSGKVMVDDLVVSVNHQAQLVQKVGSIFQNPRTQFFTTTVESELVFVCENLAMEPLAIENALQEVVEFFSLGPLLAKSMFDLSSGQQQLVGLAAAYIQHPKVLVLDEPTSNLDEQATNKLVQLLQKLKGQGATIVIADHRLLYLENVVDRIILLDDGHLMADYRVADFSSISLENRQKLGLRVFKKSDLQVLAPQVTSPNLPLFMQGKDVKIGYKALPPLIELPDFRLLKGEILIVTGRNGVGKTTLIKSLAGLLKLQAGQLCAAGQRLNDRALRRQSYLVLQDVELQLLGSTVSQELSLNGASASAIATVCQQFSLDEMAMKHPFSLSAGEQQRLALASAYLSNKSVLFLDEPTSGLDWYHMQEVVAAIQQLAEAGKTIVIVSHDQEFIRSLPARQLHLLAKASHVE